MNGQDRWMSLFDDLPRDAVGALLVEETKNLLLREAQQGGMRGLLDVRKLAIALDMNSREAVGIQADGAQQFADFIVAKVLEGQAPDPSRITTGPSKEVVTEVNERLQLMQRAKELSSSAPLHLEMAHAWFGTATAAELREYIEQVQLQTQGAPLAEAQPLPPAQPDPIPPPAVAAPAPAAPTAPLPDTQAPVAPPAPAFTGDNVIEQAISSHLSENSFSPQGRKLPLRTALMLQVDREVGNLLARTMDMHSPDEIRTSFKHGELRTMCNSRGLDLSRYLTKVLGKKEHVQELSECIYNYNMGIPEYVAAAHEKLPKVPVGMPTTAPPALPPTIAPPPAPTPAQVACAAPVSNLGAAPPLQPPPPDGQTHELLLSILRGQAELGEKLDSIDFVLARYADFRERLPETVTTCAQVREYRLKQG